MKGKLILLVKLIVLTVFYFICFAAVSSALFQLPAEQTAPQGNPALALLIVVA